MSRHVLQKLMQKLVLIDGNSLFHRAFHALPPLTSPSGELVNAVYGFASIVMNILRKMNPEYMAVAFDSSKKCFRHDSFPEYKATRKKTPQELYDQIPKIKAFVTALGVPIYEAPGYEADDILGTLAKKGVEKNDVEVIVVSGDLDTFQLVNKVTTVATPGFQAFEFYTPEKVQERLHVTPTQVIDFKGLKGDASDNIPGVRGIGTKTAESLLETYGSLENIYQNLANIPEKTRRKLENDRDTAFLSKKLATIYTSVPVELHFEQCQVRDLAKTGVPDFFRALHFTSLLKKLSLDSAPEQTKLF
ncbi:hypothetical protein HYV57_05530 [Candidatus Peregrinibacteria bacterium]|nr:hypothetical protein [Candidatus Peregrinibacteria bacterium]